MAVVVVASWFGNFCLFGSFCFAQAFWPAGVNCEWWSLINERVYFEVADHRLDMLTLFQRCEHIA